MVTIKTDVPDVVNWEKLGWEGPDTATLGAFFKRMEFRTVTRRYLDEEVADQADLFGKEVDEAPVPGRFNGDEVKYRAAVTEEEIARVVEQLMEKERICFDTETDSEDPIGASLAGISL